MLEEVGIAETPGASATGLADVIERLGCKLIARDRPLVQYLSWSLKAGVFEALAELGDASSSEIAARTVLNLAGVDALLGISNSLCLSIESGPDRYALTDTGREYFVRASPFFIGNHLYPPRGRIPRAYTAQGRSKLVELKNRLIIGLHPDLRFGTRRRLDNQHVRNLGACTVAASSEEFADVRCLVDIAGGSGAFSIPLARRRPSIRVVLSELPQAISNIRRRLASEGMSQRIELLGMDALKLPWRIPECDGVFIGNFLHAFGDETCLRICNETRRVLAHRGRIWIHEMTWNAGRSGPLVTALWNATMRLGTGRQRTVRELVELVEKCGFAIEHATPTASPFTLIAARKR